MTPSPDPDEWSDEVWFDREFSDYTLEDHEKAAIRTIRQNLAKRAYNDSENCFHHMQLLEELANKLSEITRNERAAGRRNWDIEMAYQEVKSLYNDLAQVHQSLREA